MTQVSFQGVSYPDTIEHKANDLLHLRINVWWLYDYIALDWNNSPTWLKKGKSLASSLRTYDTDVQTVFNSLNITWLQMEWIFKLSFNKIVVGGMNLTTHRNTLGGLAASLAKTRKRPGHQPWFLRNTEVSVAFMWVCVQPIDSTFPIHAISHSKQVSHSVKIGKRHYPLSKMLPAESS